MIKIRNAVSAETGLSVQIADDHTPSYVTLIWLFCLYFHAHKENWEKVAGQKAYDDKDFIFLNECIINVILKGNPRGNYIVRPGSPVLLDLALALEQKRISGNRTTNDHSYWVSKPLLKDHIKGSGFVKGLDLVDDFFSCMNMQKFSICCQSSASSFCKRTLPYLPELRAYGSPGALYAAALLEHIDRWRNQNAALVFTP